MSKVGYDHKKVEAKWQDIWAKNKLNEAADFSEKEKYYLLVEFPYPSGAGLHVGHVRSWAAMDAFARRKRMQGLNVLYPMGWDAFGLPAENYAIKTGIHPSKTVPKNIETFKKQCISLGLSFDWSRELDTTNPKYYKWTQWIFIQLFKKGLAYRSEVSVNWCPICKTNLADEEVLSDGTHERCGTMIEIRSQKQWLLRITDYADRLLKDLEKIDFSPRIRIQQENWIGRKQWIDITYPVENTKEKIVVSTTRPDTNFGATFVVIAPEHPIVASLLNSKFPISNSKIKEIEEYVKLAKSKSDFERISEGKKKTGVFTGLYAINQLNGYKMPIYITDFVLMSVGTGAVVGVPAHDERDYSFARTFKLPIKKVVDFDSETHSIVIKKSVSENFIKEVEENKWYWTDFEGWGYEITIPKGNETQYIKTVQNNLKDGPWYVHTDGKLKAVIFKDRYFDVLNENFKAKEYARRINIPEAQIDWDKEYGYLFCYTGDGVVVNSDFLDGLNSTDAIKKMAEHLEEKGWGKRTIRYHIHDWIFSRQHYWGEPIPMIFCEKCAKEGISPFKGLAFKGVIHQDQSDWNPAGWFPVPDTELPLELPYLEKYEPSGTGESPLANAKDWVHTKCPNCGGKARRETDTMPNWAGSNWYFIRYIDNKNNKTLVDRKKADYWLPVDFYQGGFEHTTLHLLYSRFIYKFLFDIGVVSTSEPYLKRRSHGIVLGADGRKMSKSFGNVINPDIIVEKFGADTLRIYEMFMGPFENVVAWSEESLEGCSRFLRRVWRIFQRGINDKPSSQTFLTKLHQTIKKVSSDIENLKFNTAIAALMELLNAWEDEKYINRKDANMFLLLLAPFAPHLAEELWQEFSAAGLKPSAASSSSIHTQMWPVFDEKLIEEEKVTIVVQINGKVRGQLEVDSRQSLNKEYVEELAKRDIKITKWLEAIKINKIIFVEGRLLNFVVSL